MEAEEAKCVNAGYELAFQMTCAHADLTVTSDIRINRAAESAD